jgi:hypothetical protein
MDRGGGGVHVSVRVVHVTWINFDPLTFILHSLNQFWIASSFVCSLCEAMAASLSMASTAVSSAKIAVIDSSKVDRSAVYNRYNNGRRTLPWGMPALTEHTCVLSFNHYKEVSAMEI